MKPPSKTPGNGLAVPHGLAERIRAAEKRVTDYEASLAEAWRVIRNLEHEAASIRSVISHLMAEVNEQVPVRRGK